MTPGVRAGRGPGVTGARLIGRARAAADRVLRLFGAGRVLQVEEVRVGVSEHLDTQALRGLRNRYLPSKITVCVSEEDSRCLRPFESTISETVQEEARRRVAGGEWRATAERIDLSLVVDPRIGTGKPPRLSSAYPAGVLRAGWKPGGGGRLEARAAHGPDASATVLRLTVTTAADHGTALQEPVLVALDPTLAVAAVGADSVQAGYLALAEDGSGLVDSTGTAWSPPAQLAFEIRQPLAAESGGAPAGTEDWNRTSVEFRLAGGGRLIWCPGGVLVVGRDEEWAHLVPEHAPSLLSRRQFRLSRTSARTLAVEDLGSTNGTWLDDRRLPRFEARAAALPAAIRVGEHGRLLVEVS